MYQYYRPEMISFLDKTRLFSYIIFLLFTLTITASFFFKETLLWMDEILSYLLISDRSLTHLNDAIVSGLDANPPLFSNVYWLIGHFVSTNIIFLKSVSVVIFATTLASFYKYITRLTGRPIINFMLLTSLSTFTYLNITLSTQIRSYALFLFISFVYFTIAHRLIQRPTNGRLLIAHTVVGLLLVLTHNFGLFYLAASGAFFGLVWLWSKEGRYWYVLSTFLLIGIAWLLIWYPNFVTQARAGEPHSWIPLPTFTSFFKIIGELAPTVSTKLEYTGSFWILSALRMLGLAALFIYIAFPRLKKGYKDAVAEPAFVLYLFAGFIYFTTILMSVVVSFAHTSIFISRYLWPNHLLVIYQMIYAFYYLINRPFSAPFAPYIHKLTASVWTVPTYLVITTGFLFYQSRKLVLAPKTVMSYVNQLDKKYPVFLESPTFFIPIWFYNSGRPIHFLLDQQSAFTPHNDSGAPVAFHIMTSVKEKYNVSAVMSLAEFNAQEDRHFFVVDEQWNYQIERFIRNKSVEVVHAAPTTLGGVRILECVFKGLPPGKTKTLVGG